MSDRAASLCGFRLGNEVKAGCLTAEPSVRLHSCEHGSGCNVLGNANVVRILPCLAKTRQGSILPEIGAGGGWGDLHQTNDLMLENDATLNKLKELILQEITDPEVAEKVLQMITEAMQTESKSLSLEGVQINVVEDDLRLKDFAHVLAKVKEFQAHERDRIPAMDPPDNLPRTVVSESKAIILAESG